MHSFKKTLLVATAFLALSACAMDEGNSESEQLLAADGSWTMVDETAPMSPQVMHDAAAAQVDPAQISAPSPMTKPADLVMAGDQDVRARVLRLEQQVAKLDHNFKALLPPLSKLIVSDNQLDAAIADIERSDDMAQSASASVIPSAQPMASAAKVAAPKMASPAPMTGGLQVSALRIGVHADKTRLVLDVTGPVKFSTDLDNTEKLLIVELAQAGWTAPSSQHMAKGGLVAGYTAQAVSGQGSRLALELTGPVKIVQASALNPGEGKGHRIVIDLAPE